MCNHPNNGWIKEQIGIRVIIQHLRFIYIKKYLYMCINCGYSFQYEEIDNS